MNTYYAKPFLCAIAALAACAMIFVSRAAFGAEKLVGIFSARVMEKSGFFNKLWAAKP